MTDLNQRMRDVLARNEKILCAVLPLGDPDFETTHRMVDLFINSGVDIVELMIPSKRPYFDSPQLHQSCQRALDNNPNYEDYLSLIKEIRQNHPEEPFEVMTYSDVVQSLTPEKFVAGLADAKIHAHLLADSIAAPASLVEELDQELEKTGIVRIRFMPHPFREDLLPDIVENGHGFMILQSITDEDGQRPTVDPNNRQLIDRVRASGTDAKILLAYGLRDPQRVREGVALDPDGVIIGTTFMERIAEKDYEGLADLISGIKGATKVQE